MSTTETRMSLAEAKAVADALVAQMSPFCEPNRCIVAGSIRRERPDVGDVEIVCIPRWALRCNPADLFGEDIPFNPIYDWAMLKSRIVWIKRGAKELIPWPIAAGDKYWRGLLECGLKIDIFLLNPNNWGLQLAIRTGPADFSHRLVTARLYGGMMPNDLRSSGGHLWRAGEMVPVPNEPTLFELLGVPFIEPKDRI